MNDLWLLLALTILFHYTIAPVKGMLDAIGTFMACMFIYAVPKGLVLTCFHGLVIPFPNDPVAQWVSGGIAFVTVAGAFLYGARRQGKLTRRSASPTTPG